MSNFQIPNDIQMSKCPNVQMSNDIQIGHLLNNLPATKASTIQSPSQHNNSKPAISGQCEQANKPYYPQHTFLPYRAITGWAVSTMPCLGKQSLRKMQDFSIWENLSLMSSLPTRGAHQHLFSAGFASLTSWCRGGEGGGIIHLSKIDSPKSKNPAFF